METAEIDELLHRYSHAESRIAANLVELDDHPTYELLTSGALVGATQAHVSAVLGDAPKMWRGLDALRRTLDRARTMRGTGRLSGDARLELEAILTRASVLVEVVHTPLGERDLLAEAATERRLTIEELLDEIRAIYEPFRDAVASIDATWRDVLPRLDAAETTLAELRSEVRELEVTEPSINLANARVTELRRLIMDDPLSIDASSGKDLDGAVADAARRVGQLRRAHASLEADLARTEVLVADMRALRSRAAVSFAEAQAKVKAPEGLVPVPSAKAVDELARQAAAMRSSDEPWQTTRTQLDTWLSVAERLAAQLNEAARRNVAPIARRDELRGLLSAYRAKAAAVGLIEQPDLSELIDEAHNELFTAPADLQRSERLVAKLGAGTRADGGSGDR